MDLLQAARTGDRERVRDLLEKGVATGARDEQGLTALHWAVRGGHEDVVRLLLEHGADPAAITAGGSTPLEAAILSGRIELADLLRAHLDPEARRADPSTPRSPLYAAAARGDAGEVSRLLEAGQDPNATALSLQTPLHRAAWGGHVETARRLLAAGADPNARDDAGNTPLHGAALHRHAPLLQLLLESGAEASMRNESGSTALHLVAAWGEPEEIRMLLEAGASLEAVDGKGKTPLHLAAQVGDPRRVILLLEEGASPEVKDGKGMSALDWAREKQHLEAARILAASAPPGPEPEETEDAAPRPGAEDWIRAMRRRANLLLQGRRPGPSDLLRKSLLELVSEAVSQGHDTRSGDWILLLPARERSQLSSTGTGQALVLGYLGIRIGTIPPENPQDRILLIGPEKGRGRPRFQCPLPGPSRSEGSPAGD